MFFVCLLGCLDMTCHPVITDNTEVSFVKNVLVVYQNIFVSFFVCGLISVTMSGAESNHR